MKIYTHARAEKYGGLAIGVIAGLIVIKVVMKLYLR